MKYGNELIAELETIGEPEVSAKLARSEYGSQGIRREAVVEWLRMKAQSRADDSSREQIRIAREAADAARAAATEARKANKHAIIAIVIAAISAIIALFS